MIDTQLLLAISAAVVIIVILYRSRKTENEFSYFQREHFDNVGGSSPSVNALHWNAHFQCFRKGNSCCSSVAMDYISKTLVSEKIDFANIIEMRAEYKPPSGYKLNLGHCGGSGVMSGGDLATLIYNANKWDTISPNHKFCIGGRPANFQHFKSKSNPSFTIWVMGVHFTHHRDSYVSGMNKAIKSLGIRPTDNVLFMADTNQKGSSETLMQEMIGGKPRNILASQVRGTCCFSGRKRREGFSFHELEEDVLDAGVHGLMRFGQDLFHHGRYANVSKMYSASPRVNHGGVEHYQGHHEGHSHPHNHTHEHDHPAMGDHVHDELGAGSNPSGHHFSLPYDRIIATFGSRIHSTFPEFSDVIGTQKSGCDYGEMHLPVISYIQ